MCGKVSHRAKGSPFGGAGAKRLRGSYLPEQFSGTVLSSCTSLHHKIAIKCKCVLTLNQKPELVIVDYDKFVRVVGHKICLFI